MCGRYTIYDTSEILSHYELNFKYNIQIALQITDNYNVSPGAHMPVIIRDLKQNSLEFMI